MYTAGRGYLFQFQKENQITCYDIIKDETGINLLDT